MTDKTDPTVDSAHARYYVIFDELSRLDAPDVNTEELDEIEQIRRMVLEVSDEQPTFMTST